MTQTPIRSYRYYTQTMTVFPKGELLRQVCIRVSLICIVSFLFAANLNAQGGRMTAMPSSLTVLEGQTFDLLWFIHPGRQPVSAADFVLSYDTDDFSVLEIIQPESPLNVNPIKPRIEPEQGRVIYSAFRFQPPWPAEPFQFVKLRIKALRANDEARLQHKLDATPYSSMAYEGISTLESAPDVVVKILSNDSPIQNSDIPGTPVLKTDPYGIAPDEWSFVFINSADGHAAVHLTPFDSKEGLVLFNDFTKAGAEYNMSIPKGILTGKYQIHLHAASGVLSLTLD